MKDQVPSQEKSWTLLSLLKKAQQFFEEKEIPSARLEAEILLAHTLACDRVKLYADYDRPMKKPELDRFRELIMKRVAGEPTAYLTGVREFFSLSFQVTPAVLIPRHETEEVVQMALDRIPGEGEGMVAADVGTGSGCIAVTLLKLKKQLAVCAFDLSADALEVASQNAEQHGVTDRVTFHCGDLLFASEEPGGPSAFHLIVCNPPYVDPAGSQPVDREVRVSEPRGAVFSPPGDPLYYYREMLDRSVPFLHPEGMLIFELGMDLKPGVTALAERMGWNLVESRTDLLGHARAIGFDRPGQ